MVEFQTKRIERRKDCERWAGDIKESATRRSIFILPYFILFYFFAIVVSAARAESGLASYYSPSNRGGPGDLTCAHRTRPFGSIVTVSYHGQSIHCRITDRGPFIRGRVIDLSVNAARTLGMTKAGVVFVLLK
jgi:rare lipoprotein A